MRNFENVIIYEKKERNLREGVRIMGVATYNGQKVWFKTHTLLESRVCVHLLDTGRWLFDTNTTDVLPTLYK